MWPSSSLALRLTQCHRAGAHQVDELGGDVPPFDGLTQENKSVLHIK